MKDVYVEWLIKRERNFVDKLVRAFSIVVLVICSLLLAFTAQVLIFVLTVAVAFFAYFAFTYTDVEYEYLYISGEFSIDRILAKSKRKRVEKIEVSKIEIVAPLNSDKLGGFAGKKYREYDYTRGIKSPDSHIFVMYYAGKKILFEPNRELIEALRSVIPHKVHMY